MEFVRSRILARGESAVTTGLPSQVSVTTGLPSQVLYVLYIYLENNFYIFSQSLYYNKGGKCLSLHKYKLVNLDIEIFKYLL